MFHLRRSQFLQVFNNSPDETTYYRNVLNREDVNSSLIMIQPTLMSFSMEAPPQPVLLDSVSIQPNASLLLDTFFHVLVWHGETIASWRKAKYHENPTYAAFKEMLEAQVAEAQVNFQLFIHNCRFRICYWIDSPFRDILNVIRVVPKHDFCFLK